MEGETAPARRKGRPPKDPERAAERAALAAVAGCEAKQPRGVKRKKMFTRDLGAMMYGFGDVSHPLPESIDLLEDMAVEFIVEMTQKALQMSNKGKVQTEDLIFLLRKDRKKHERALELLRMSEELKRARKVFDGKEVIKDATEDLDEDEDL